MFSIHPLEDSDIHIILQPILEICCLVVFQATKFQIISSEHPNTSACSQPVTAAALDHVWQCGTKTCSFSPD